MFTSLNTLIDCMRGRQNDKDNVTNRPSESIQKIEKIADRLLRRNGDPLYGHRFALTDSFGCVLGTTTTDMQGRFSFDLKNAHQYSKLKLVRIEDSHEKDNVFLETLFHEKSDAIELVSPFKPSKKGLTFSYLEFNKYRLPEDPTQIPNVVDLRSIRDTFIVDAVPFLKEQLVAIDEKLLPLEQKVADFCNIFGENCEVEEKTREDVQKLFDGFRKKIPLKHDNATLVKMIMEWWVPNLKKEGDNQYYFELDWDLYRNKDPRNSGHDLPNLKVSMEPRKDGMVITKIRVQPQGKSPVSFHPVGNTKLNHGKKEIFPEVLKMLATGVLLAAELKHLGEAHLGMGFWAQLTLKYLPEDHPVRKFLNPLIEGNLSINQKGVDVLVNPPDGFFGSTAISENILDAYLSDLRCKYDYFSRPARPLFEGDDYAVKANAFFDQAYKESSDFIEKNWNEIKKPDNWAALFYLSKNGVEESFPYHKQDLSAFVDPNPIEGHFKGIDKLDRIKGKDGKLRTVRPIIAGDIKGPKGGDKERITLWLTHLFNLDYMHHVLHTQQNPYAMDTEFALLSSGEKLEAVAKQLFTAQILTDFPIDERVIINHYPSFKDENILKIFQEANGNVVETMEGIFI